MFVSHWRFTLLVLFSLGLVAATSPASGATIITSVMVDFNDLSTKANSSDIASYISGLVPGSVTVSGAGGSNRYDGEGYVVGPKVNGVVQSYTLGTTDFGVYHGGFDNFIVNPSGSDRFTMNFTDLIYAVSFDFEIFPNAVVPDGTNTTRPFPDFTFEAFLGDQRLEHYHVVSVLPGTNGTFQSSPNHSTERAPQFLGSASFVFPNGVDRLVFIDWPERIGIDNLGLQFSSFSPDPPTTRDAPTSTPEPSSLVLMGVLFAGAGICLRCRKRQRSQGGD
jgi:hypothetical protein